MMDVLRRLRNLGADDEAEYNDEAGQEGDEEGGGEDADIDIGEYLPNRAKGCIG